eukprot:jgi/Astpho2/411/Aster-03461
MSGPRVAPDTGLKDLSFHIARDPSLRWDTTPFQAAYYTVVASSAWSWWTQAKNAWSFKHKIMLTILLHALAMLSTHWSVRVKLVTRFFKAPRWQSATHCKVTPTGVITKKEVVPLEKRTLGEGVDAEEEISFVYRKQRFVFNEDAHCFKKLDFPVEEHLTTYATSSGYTSEGRIMTATDRWGPNKFEVPLPQFGLLLQEQLLAPFFCFQVFCVGLWALDEYWYYSLFTLGMLVMFECTVVTQRMRNLKELRSLQTPKQPIQAYRHGKWGQLPGDALLPGDLVSIGRPRGGEAAEEQVVSADMLLLAGTCIVEEAVLTGESTPQWKQPVPAAAAAGQPGNGLARPSDRLSIKRDKAHVLFGGTKILQHTGDKEARIRTPDGGCLAVVLRTGFETSQGQLMRTILYSTERVTANNWETGLFILFLLFFAVAASAYVLHHGLKDPDRDRFKLFLNCTMILTSVIPPELPMELSIAVNASLLALARKAVFCTEPFRIPLAGKVDVCCFDKTGTLTSDNMVLEGVAGLPGRGSELMADVQQAGSAAIRVLACCHSLIHVDGDLVGDPLEKAAFIATGWKHAGEQWTSGKGKGKETATILHRLHFSSTLKRMAAVVKVEADSGSATGHWVLLKGAPEVVQPMLEQVPGDFEAAYKQFASQGARVIALAYKQLPSHLSTPELRELPREQLESKLQFGGFAVLQCPLKPESAPTLEMLRDSSHQLVMITGDQPLTACHAASRVSIVDRPVLILSEPDEGFEWVTPDESTRLPFVRSPEAALQLAQEWDLCISGDGLLHLQHIGAEPVYIPLAQVFARVAPEQKELVLHNLRGAGWTTLMCGDGTNDVGALKTAHIGVALLAPTAAMLKRGQQGPPGAPKGPQKPGTKMLEDLKKKGKVVTPKMEEMAKWMDSLDPGDAGGDAPMVKPGDASMAAPFTVKQGNIGPCCDILKQGRSTLVTTVQMFKILGLLCLSTAYSLSVMYLQGIKLGDMQATLQGFLSAGLFFVVSNATPCPKLSAQRPHPHILCAYVFLSVISQFAVHLAFLAAMYQGALSLMPKDEAQAPDSDFKPNLVNTVCYVIQFIIQLTTFAVNYQGHPFNSSITETKGFFNLLKWSYVFIAIVPIPEPLRSGMVALAFSDFALTYGLEHMLRAAFPASTPPKKGYQAILNKKSNRQRHLNHSAKKQH